MTCDCIGNDAPVWPVSRQFFVVTPFFVTCFFKFVILCDFWHVLEPLIQLLVNGKVYGLKVGS